MIGVYALLLKVDLGENIQVGKRLRINVEKGFYAYVGSALAGLEQRLDRHMRTEKKLHWHIDYLLQRGSLRTIIYAQTKERKECLIAQALASCLPSVFRFGCSDCPCKSHLFFSPDLATLESQVINAFMKQNLMTVNKLVAR
jgi:Uri superfamily endonuclease